jgi:hypothetical protein
MWKVENKKNYKILKLFEKNVILPFFNNLLASKREKYQDFIQYLENNKTNKNYKILNYISKRKYKKKKFIDCINNLLKLDYNELEKYYNIYKEQNKKIEKNNLDIKIENIPKDLKAIFIEFFYEKFFNISKIWELIETEMFCRKKFHINFKKENSIFVCPYCDADTFTNSGNGEIEHFFPKSQFPFLAMNGLNLISSCHSCNKSFEGKGNKEIPSPISMPYLEQIGDCINFKIDILEKIIKLDTNEDRITNYIDLFQLDKRYSEDIVYKYIIESGKSWYDKIIEYKKKTGYNISSDELKKFIIIAKKNDEKVHPYFFALKSLYSNYDNYQKNYVNLK